MIKPSFYDNQQVDNTDLNAATDNAEQADKDLAKEAVGYGITSGFSVVSVGGHMEILVNVGTLIDKTGQRCQLAAPIQPTITQDTAETAVAVGAGQERWVAVFLKVSRALTDYETDPSGGVEDITNYTVQTPVLNPAAAVADPGGADVNTTPTLYVVCGDAAAIDAAERPALDSEAILLCDLNVREGQSDYTGSGTIDFQRTELLRLLEPDESFVASDSGLSTFSLVRQYQRGLAITREYITRTGGKITTINAEAVPSATKAGAYKWQADDYDEDSLMFALGKSWGGMGGGFAGAFQVLSVAGETYDEPWLDATGAGGWTSEVSLPA